MCYLLSLVHVQPIKSQMLYKYNDINIIGGHLEKMAAILKIGVANGLFSNSRP